MKRIDAAIAVICRGDKILICQRRDDDTFGGMWEFPGGKRENGETLEQCLHRELKEELAISVRIVRPLEPIRHDYPHVRLTLHPFLCDSESGQPATIECQKVLWVDPGELDGYEFPSANQSLLEEIRRSWTQWTQR